MTLRAILAVSLAVAGCAASAPSASPPVTGRAPHARPSTHAMSRALEPVGAEALRCLPGGEAATVTGEFDGNTGDFMVQRITNRSGGALAYPVEQCVRASAERAHVRPFTDETATFTRTFEGPPATDVSVAAVRAPEGPLATPAPAITNVSGSIEIGSHASASDLVRREGEALQRCYEQATEREPTVSGRVELHLTLAPDGQIVHMSSRIDAPPHDDITLMELVARCIESHVRLIRFGRQGQAQHEEVIPLAFHPGGIPID